MKIAIIGYGKMGRVIEEVALAEGHEIVVRIDSQADWEKSVSMLEMADVAIEFSAPNMVVSNILRCFEANIPVVVGTTAWEENQENIREICVKGNHSLFVASNFSIGVNIFTSLNKTLASIMSSQPQYEVRIDETHHLQKLDSPSGTAILLANGVIGRIAHKEKWVNQTSEKKEEVSIISHRIDKVPGTHVVSWFSDEDEIVIQHVAKSRIGFARGALQAAGWLIGKKGVFGMENMLHG